MTTPQIAQYLTYPALLDDKSLADIDALVNEYPWYAGGQMLLARNLYNLKHLRYPTRLKMASAATVNRSLLKEFVLVLNEKPKSAAIPDLVAIVPELAATVPELAATVPELVAIVPELAATVPELAATVPDLAATVPGLAAAVPDLAAVVPDLAAVVPDLAVVVPDLAAVVADLSATVAETPFNTQNQVTGLPLIPFEPYSQFDFTSELLKLPEIARETPKLSQADLAEAKMSFSDWLKKSKHAGEEPKSSGIIDKFITENPRISKPKHTEFFKPQDAARKSLVQPMDISTETLANIYEKQGHLEKAILAFENLSVRHPEKSSYFATRILSLKERLKS